MSKKGKGKKHMNYFQQNLNKQNNQNLTKIDKNIENFDENNADENAEKAWDTRQAANFLGIEDPNILNDWARKGIGPKCMKLRGRRYYSQEVIRKFKEDEFKQEIYQISNTTPPPDDAYPATKIYRKLGVSSSLLTTLRASFRERGEGPRFIEVGSRYYYPKSDMNQFLLQNCGPELHINARLQANNITLELDNISRFYDTKGLAKEFCIKESTLVTLRNQNKEPIYLKFGGKYLYPKELLPPQEYFEELRERDYEEGTSSAYTEEQVDAILKGLPIEDSLQDFRASSYGKECLVIKGIRYHSKLALEDFLCKSGIYTEKKAAEFLETDINILKHFKGLAYRVILGIRYYLEKDLETSELRKN
ncbi:hypothetical protein [Helicobacter ailurogastricus]|uniref:hypothetical protein n=1 Tax=Helicobacter ailurogastricus TaxID=1578720 RepID=UPI0022C8A225|nr:hypothetical protein [Helicobacter ailurogastricus]GLH58674.1 hypothetical protein NHP214376_14690 [Helicobacter ailurogastricus]GLH60200.1 hypothetical protein NHP214377_14770 [Helicobacter ailurogastricus]